jgi:uncharacterized cupin superfamily protein
MSNSTIPIRLDPNGPNGSGLGEWHLMINESCAAPPLERRKRFFIAERPAGQIRASVWESGPYTETIDYYPMDEFMVVIEGSVTLIFDDDHRETFRAGDTFFIPLGTKVVWKQEERMKKFCLVYADWNVEE